MVFCVTSFLELLCAIMLYRECKILSSRIICVVNCSHNSFELRWQEIILKKEVRAICNSTTEDPDQTMQNLNNHNSDFSLKPRTLVSGTDKQTETAN